MNYIIADIECLEDYFSLQLKTSSDNEVTIYECYNLQDCNNLYNYLKTISSPLYFYSIDYDKTMLQVFCKLVETSNDSILSILRDINNYIIKGLNFKSLRSNFWKLFFAKKSEDFKVHYEQTLLQFSTSLNDVDFVKKYNYLFCQSKIYKSLNVLEIPKILYYYNIDKNNNIKPSISLKNLQLVNEGYSIKFDFNKYTKIEDIKNDGLYEKWIEYSKNDITSLEKIFNGKPKKDIEIRLAAIKAVKLLDPNIEFEDDMIYSETNTKLINHILKIKDPNKNVELNYSDYIHTNYKKFNDFVEHVNNMQHVVKDSDVKTAWVTDTQIEEDGHREVHTDNIAYVVNSVDKLQIRNIEIKFGLGGLHGDSGNTIENDLLHLDYTSQYPSIILQYKHLFQQIINVKLYEQIYNLRLDLKSKKIEDELQNGLKLILNSSYGIINSPFDLDISCKKLGRFICLKGQSLLLSLTDRLPQDVKLYNVNTDGLICDIFEDVEKVIKDDRDGYFNLDSTIIERLIQRDVNNYLKKVNGKWKSKGMFNVSIKQKLNINEKLSVNLENALRLVKGEEIIIEPIYFKTNKFRDLESTAYYLTKNGNTIIKDTVKPETLGINGSPFLFSTNKDEADLEEYSKYANIVKEAVLNFTYTTNKHNKIKHYDLVLQQDTVENNTEIKQIRRKLSKLFESKNLGLTGYKGDLKKDCFCNRTPVSTLRHYTMTEILQSTECKGISLYANDTYTIIDVDIYDKSTGKAKDGWQVCKPLLQKLANLETFECWNRITHKYNKKFIFKKCDFKIPTEMEKYIEIVEKAVIWTLDIFVNKYDCNFNEIKELI